MTVLIGESASGKSTLMKVIIFMRYIYKMLNIRWYLKNSGIKKTPFKLSFDKLLNDELAQYFSKEKGSYILYEVSINDHTYSLEYKDGTLNTKETNNIPNKDLVFLKESWISESRNIIPLWTSKASSNKRSDLGFYFHETQSDFDKATDNLQSVAMNFIGMNLAITKQGGKKKYYISPNDGHYKEIELKYASSGVQTSAPLITLINYYSKAFSFKDAGRRSILDYLYEQDRLSSYRPDMEISEMGKIVHIHIEEPELSLFPTSQCQLIDDMVRLAFIDKTEDRSIGLMIATHSPYIINYLNVILYQNKSKRAALSAQDMAVYRIFDGRLQSLLVQTQDGRYLVDTSDLTEQMKSILSEYRSLTE